MNKPKMQIALGIALGAGIGAALGVAAGHIAVWLALGLAIGVAIGGSLRSTPCAECEAIHKEHQSNDENLVARSDSKKESHHGITGASIHTGPGQSQRPD